MKKSVSKEVRQDLKGKQTNLKPIKQRDRCASEDKLLNAAEAVFSKYGFKGATTRMISLKARMNEALIGRYFEGKFGLLLALIERKVKRMRLVELPYPPQSTLTAELLAFAKFKICDMKLHSNFFKIIISQSLTDPKFLKRAQEKIPMSHDNPQLEARIRLLIAAQKVRADIDMKQFLNDLDVHFMGVFLFQILLRCDLQAEVEKQLENFVTTYAASYIQSS